MLSFHNDQEVKDFYVNRVREHYEKDEIIKGKYWENGRGCGMGCTVHSGKHSAYEGELGIPRILARLEDGIFEGLPNKIAKEFPLRFLEAIPVGVDLSMVFYKFMLWLIMDEKAGVYQYASEKGKVSIQNVADLFTRIIAGEEINNKEWRDADAAAASAPDTAADAAADASAAIYAVSAADTAAYAADAYDAAADIARQKHRVLQADKLIELLEQSAA